MPSAFRRVLRRHASQLFRKTRDVLVHASSPMNVVVMRPILDALLSDPRVRVHLAAKYRRADDAAAMIRATGLERVNPLTAREAARLRADLYLCAEGSRPAGKRSHRRVVMFHGASFKGRSIAKKLKFFDRVLLVGPWQHRQFVARGYFDADDPRLVRCGMPKLDALVTGSIDTGALRARLRIPERARVVLYAPTWGEHSSMFKMGESVIEHAARVPNVHVVVKFHDHLLDPHHSPIDWAARARAWTYPNVSIHDDLDVVPALALADVLISDASSVLQEFTLLDRPIVYCDVPELFASKRYKKTADTDTWAQKGGIVVGDGAAIGPALERCFADPSEFSPIRRKIAADVFYNPGAATKAALSVIHEELGWS
jgi:hypothetical protein